MSETVKEKDLRPEVEVTLQFPITVDGETRKSLTMRRPKVGDSKWAQRLKSSDFERGIGLLARLCDVPPEVIEELDDLDAEALNDQLESFRGSGAS